MSAVAQGAPVPGIVPPVLVPTKIPLRFVPPLLDEMSPPVSVMLPPIVVLWDVADSEMANVDPLPFTEQEIWFAPPSATRFAVTPFVPMFPISRNSVMP